MRKVDLSVLAVALLISTAACKKEEPKAEAVKAEAPKADEAKKDEAPKAEEAKPVEAPKVEAAKPAGPAPATPEQIKAVEEKLAAGQAADVAAGLKGALEAVRGSKTNEGGDGFDPTDPGAVLLQKAFEKADGLVKGQKDPAEKQKLVDTFSMLVADALVVAPNNALPGKATWSPACAWIAGSPAAADKIATSFANFKTSAHSAMATCLFQSGPQGWTALAGTPDDLKIRTERLAKAVAGTASGVELTKLISLINNNFEVAPGVDSLGDALFAKYNAAETQLVKDVAAALMNKCNVKQLDALVAKTSELPEPVKAELSKLATDYAKLAKDKCK